MNKKIGAETADSQNQPAPSLPKDATLALGPSTDRDAVALPPQPSDPTELSAEPKADGEGKGLSFLQPGTRPDSLGRLGHYEMLQVLGRGGFGVVLRAVDEKLHRMVAVKVLDAALAGNATARKRFVREARAAAAVSSRHVVGIYDVNEEPVPYLVMEYIAGQTLQEKLDRSGPLELKEILRIGCQVAEGLAAAHRQGLIHRDIKPGNILLENGVERVKITDFGLARAADDASLTQSGAIVGTPMFMAPEQAQDDPVDHRADLFSLGSVLYVMCTGRPPFRAPSTLAVLKRVCEETPRPIPEVNSDIPDWLAAIVDKLMAKQPAARVQTATEVADLFRQHLVQVGGVATTPRVGSETVAYVPPPGESKVRRLARRSRRWAGVVGISAALVATAGLLGFALWPTQPGDEPLPLEITAQQLAEHRAELWTVLRPTSVESKAGAKLTVQEDGSILASGTNAGADCYTVVFDRVEQPVRAVRLEALTHPSLPKQGPGRHSSGNFQLAEITLQDAPSDPKAKETQHPIAKAAASYHWTGMNVERAFDGSARTAWHVWSRTGRDHWAIFTPAQPIALPTGNRLIIRLQHMDSSEAILLGRFRLSVTNHSNPEREENLMLLAQEVSGWSRMAAVHVLRQEWQQAQTALGRVTVPAEKRPGHDHLLLALVHQQQGRQVEADQALERALAWARANPASDAFLYTAFAVFSPGQGKEWKNPAWFQLRARWHAQHQRSAEATADLARAVELNPALVLEREDIKSLTAMADQAASQGRWEDVQRAVLRAIEVDPSDQWQWYRAGVILAYLNDAGDVNRHRTAMLERFGTSKDPVIAERIAKSCLLLPAEGDELNQLAGLADLAVTKGQDHWILPYAQMARGLAEYRQRNYDAAESQLRQALANSSGSWLVKGPAELILAMSQQQRGQAREAQETLKRALARLEKDLPELGSPTLGSYWHDWLVCQTLRREAESLIEGKKP